MSYARKNLYANPATLYGDIPQGDEVEPIPGWGMNPLWAGPAMVGVGATEEGWFRMLGDYPILTDSGRRAFVADMDQNNPGILETMKNGKANVLALRLANGKFTAATGDNWLINKKFVSDWPGYAIVSTMPGELRDEVNRRLAEEKKQGSGGGASRSSGTGISKASMALGAVGVLGILAFLWAQAKRS